MSQSVSRADLHIHTMASDGTASVSQVLARAEEVGLDLIAITDHDRIDAAQAAQQMAQRNGLRVQVIVGEEISTLQGHLLGLFLQERIRPLRSLRRSIAEIHEQGGIAIVAHPLFPHPLCAQEGTIRSVAADRDPASQPDGHPAPDHADQVVPQTVAGQFPPGVEARDVPTVGAAIVAGFAIADRDRDRFERKSHKKNAYILLEMTVTVTATEQKGQPCIQISHRRRDHDRYAKPDRC